tara:strand:+ start:455 stop:727 length:273 start_codon:yes stop_codon:yes gene_type:complete
MDKVLAEEDPKAPCRICISIRLFLVAVFGLTIMVLVDPSMLSALASLSPMTIAISVVGLLAAAAISKMFLELRKGRMHKKKFEAEKESKF